MLTAFLPCLAFAAPKSHLPPEVERYAQALQAARDRQGTVDIEPVFRLGEAAAAKLEPILESLSDADFSLAKKKMRGFFVNREEALFVEPNGRFFLRWSERNGTRADASFFRVYLGTHPVAWAGIPVYVSQQTDAGGCSLFDGKLLAFIYMSWLDYRKAFPGRYAREVDAEIQAVRRNVLTETCACRGKEETLEALRAFADAFPGSPLAARVLQRISAIRRKPSIMRFNCVAN